MRPLKTLALSFVLSLAAAAAVAAPSEIRVDWATYNPVSIVLKDRKILEEELAPDGISVRWLQSAGSNKALEFLNAGSLDFGSSAGAAALIARANGNPVKAIYVYSRPEWTALVAGRNGAVASVADLKGKSVAATRGTDPHIFLIRALAGQGLTEKDVRVVPLQHADGRLALARGDVDAWAGLDPIMASAELDDGAKLVYRNPDFNSWGVLDVREAFLAENPELARRVVAAYEKARKWALAHPAELAALLEKAAKLPAPVIERQLSRTELTHGPIGAAQKETLVAAGEALKQAGVIKPDVDVKATVDALVDSSVAGAPATQAAR